MHKYQNIAYLHVKYTKTPAYFDLLHIILSEFTSNTHVKNKDELPNRLKF